MADQTKRKLSGLRRNQQFLYIGIFTLVAVIVWVAGSLFQSQKKTGISSELQKMALPLNPNVNVQAVERIESKTTYSPDELENFQIYRILVEDLNRAQASQPAPDADSSGAGGSLSDVISDTPPVISIETPPTATSEAELP